MRFSKSTTQLPSIIDDCNDNTYIVSLFLTTYSDLYNSVSTPVHLVDSLYSKIILDSHGTRQPHNIIKNCYIRTAIKGPKSENYDGSTNLTSDSLINRTDLLFKCTSNVFTINVTARLYTPSLYDVNHCPHSKRHEIKPKMF